jgi:hypothetical protein
MKRKDTAKRMEPKSCLNISDWVAFLSSERQAMMSNAVTFSVFLVAVIALILVTSGHIAFAIASGVIAFGCAGWVYFGVLEPLRQRGKLADEILKGIISGELKDADSIRQGWLLGLTVIRRGWFRQGKARLAVLKRAWRRQWKPRLATLKETWDPRWAAGLATLKKTWHRQRARLAALKETWRPRWERGISALKETWCQGKARSVAFRETWRRQWEGGISYSQASVAPVGSATSYAHGHSASRNKSKQARVSSRKKKNAT